MIQSEVMLHLLVDVLRNSVLITGLSYGLYKGMLDNYLAEVVKMGDRV